MHFSFLVAAAFAIWPIFVLAVPTPQCNMGPIDWTYRDIYNHAIANRHGRLIADLVEQHIFQTSRSWDDVYHHDIQLYGGATLTLPNHPSGRHFLTKLGEPISHSYVQAFP